MTQNNKNPKFRKSISMQRKLIEKTIQLKINTEEIELKIANEVNEIWKKIYKKYRRSLALFISLNLLIFIITALITVLNLFALRFQNNDELRIYFLIISIITNISAFLTSFGSLFSFRINYGKISKKIYYIKQEINFYEAKMFEYSGIDRDKIFMKKIRKIFTTSSI